MFSVTRRPDRRVCAEPPDEEVPARALRTGAGRGAAHSGAPEALPVAIGPLSVEGSLGGADCLAQGTMRTTFNLLYQILPVILSFF